MFKKLPVIVAPGFFTSFWPSALNLSDKLKDLGFDVFSPGPSFLSLLHIHTQAFALSKLVDEALSKHKTKKCNIIGVSMGGIVALYYLHELDGAKKVNTCITIGTPFRGTPAAYPALLFAPSAWEIIPGSSLIKYLSQKPKPPGVKMYNFSGKNDLLCPPRTSRYEFGKNKMFDGGHADVCLGANEEVLKYIELILNTEEPVM